MFNNKGQYNNCSQRSLEQKYQNYTGETYRGIDIFCRLNSSLILSILPWIAICGTYGIIVVSLNQTFQLSENNNLDALARIALTLNFVLSLLLAFRTNTAYNRFWEGRKLWGAMVNVVRNLTRGIWVFIKEESISDREEKKAAVKLVTAFALAMKYHLRKEKINWQLKGLVSPQQSKRIQVVDHVPLEIAFWLTDYLQKEYHKENLNVFQLDRLQSNLDDMVDILGGCERILKTPVPIIYTIIFKILLIVYFLLLPFGLVQEIGWWTAPAMAFISFIILSINEIGAEIEQPFGHDYNDLPLDFICKTILNNVEHLLSLDPTSSYLKINKLRCNKIA